jgi:hypothetical protein
MRRCWRVGVDKAKVWDRGSEERKRASSVGLAGCCQVLERFGEYLVADCEGRRGQNDELGS